MSNVLPSPPAGMPPGVRLPSRIAVDPAALAYVPAELLHRVQALRSGAPSLLSAWDQAAGVLAAERTGAVLASSRPGSAAALEACAATVEVLAWSLHRGAVIYASAESAAVGDRA